MVKPLTMLNATGLTTLNQYYVVSKLPEFLDSSSQPDVIMTGSSLFLHPAVRCDDRFSGRRTRYDALYIRDFIDPYVNCDYLASLLKKSSGKPVSITNLATAGALFSDQYMVLKKCIAKGKTPKVVVCDISPRSFLDRNQTEIEKTPVYLVMADYLSLDDLIEAKASLSSILQSFVGSKWSYLRDRTDYREVFKNFACRLTGHPGDLFSAKNREQENVNAEPANSDGKVAVLPMKPVKNEPLYTPKAFDKRDLKYYKQVYLPIDWKMYAKEMEFLRLYLELARAKHIAVVMVEVPLPKANLALLPDGLRSKYQSDAAALAAQYKANLVEPATSSEFLDSDFEDNAHLNADGGEKMYKSITPAIGASLN
ncbi:MAG: DUF1574 family protein [Candidatus Obscuribacterales bacterium]